MGQSERVGDGVVDVGVRPAVRLPGRGAGSTRRAHAGRSAAAKMATDVRGPLVRGTGIESVTACQTARTLSPTNLCGDLDTVHGLPSGGCGDLSAEREFPSDKVYRRDDRGIVGVESFGPQGLAFVIHTSVGRAACRYGSPLVHGRFGH